MGISVASITASVKSKTQQFNNIPNPEQLLDAINTAISEVSDRSPFLAETDISVVSGTQDYALPSDFQSIYEFPIYDATTGGYIVGNALYSGSSRSETVSIIGGMLRITPTPSYTQTRKLQYFARYTGEVSGDTIVYSELTDKHMYAIVWRAVAIIAQMKADKAAEQAWIQQNEDTRIDMSKKYRAFMDEADFASRQFEDVMSRITSGNSSAYGTKSKIDNNPYDYWMGGSLL